jgi:hypothetical protein
MTRIAEITLMIAITSLILIVIDVITMTVFPTTLGSTSFLFS